jgi:hypothetical protein
VWLALSVQDHSHHAEAWNWLNLAAQDARLVFIRFTHIGLMRLLSNTAVMGEQALSLRRAWNTYDRWLEDPRVEFYPEPAGLDAAFRRATAPFDSKAASKWVGDCYLLAHAKEIGAVLVTFDRALATNARKQDCAAIIPA